MMFFAGLSVLFSMSMIIITSTAYGTVLPKYASLVNWASYSACVSEYEQISGDEAIMVSDLASNIKANFALSILISIISVFNIISASCICCKSRSAE